MEAMEGCRGRVIESIGSQREEVAKALGMGQEDSDRIKTTHSDEDICCGMLATGNNGECIQPGFDCTS